MEKKGLSEKSPAIDDCEIHIKAFERLRTFSGSFHANSLLSVHLHHRSLSRTFLDG
jgi:hypothetical protein